MAALQQLFARYTLRGCRVPVEPVSPCTLSLRPSCPQVQWYERRANMPAHLQEGMHDREVAEWLQTDTNLVGCIERKARILKADSYEQALIGLAQGDAAGEWHFCRGVMEVETLQFRTYAEVEAGVHMLCAHAHSEQPPARLAFQRAAGMQGQVSLRTAPQQPPCVVALARVPHPQTLRLRTTCALAWWCG